MSKLAVVTGGTGFIGWNLCERLRDCGWVVRAVVRPTSDNPLPDGVERVDARLRADEMQPSLEGAQVVYHLAGLTRASSYEQFLRINAEGARQTAIAAQRAGAFMLAVSSQAAAGPGTPAAPAREKDEPRPVSLYGRSKLAGEAAIRQIAELRWAIIRPPAVYGPRDRDFLTLFRMGRRGLFPLLGAADTAYTLVHVSDAVDALITVAEAGVTGDSGVQGETFFIGHPEIVRSADFSSALGAIFDRRVRSLRVPRPLLWTLAEIGELAGKLGRPALVNRSRYRELTAPGFVCDVSKIQRHVGHTARLDLRRGFAATADWYRARGML